MLRVRAIIGEGPFRDGYSIKTNLAVIIACSSSLEGRVLVF